MSAIMGLCKHREAPALCDERPATAWTAGKSSVGDGAA